MKRGRIKVTLYNRTLKEIDMSDFSYISEDIFSNRSDVVKIELPGKALRKSATMHLKTATIWKK